jgi:hypothetical protein
MQHIDDEHLDRLVARLRERITPNSPEYVKAIVRQAEIIENLQERLDRITRLAETVDVLGRPVSWENLVAHIGRIASGWEDGAE